MSIKSEAFLNLIDTLCIECKNRYFEFIDNQYHTLEEENDWDCTSYGEYIPGGPLDRAIAGQESEYEEEIDLYKTYGGD
jgi:hypothetical protein